MGWIAWPFEGPVRLVDTLDRRAVGGPSLFTWVELVCYCPKSRLAGRAPLSGLVSAHLGGSCNWLTAQPPVGDRQAQLLRCRADALLPRLRDERQTDRFL